MKQFIKTIAKHRLRIVALFLVMLLTTGYVGTALAKPLISVSPEIKLTSSQNAQGVPNIMWSAYGQQAVGVDGKGVMATEGVSKPVPIASLAKVMVAIAVLQKKPLALQQDGPDVPITAADVAIYNADNVDNQSVVIVAAGEKLTEYQALQELMLGSATNMAVTLTNWAYGSQSSYLAYANSYAKQLGMNQSNFADASGYDPATTSTASDIVLLAEQAVQNAALMDIANQFTAVVPLAGEIQNFNIDVTPNNPLGIDGLKTGNTDQAGGCFIYSAKYHGHHVVGVILGAPDLGTALYDAPNVLSSVVDNLQNDNVIHAGQVVASYKLPWGGNVNAVAATDETTIDWQNSRYAKTVKLQKVSIGAKQGTSVGTVSYTDQGVTRTAAVHLQTSATRPSVWWRLRHP